MDLGEIGQRRILLVGCGKMGSALLAGWLEGGLAASDVSVLEPSPTDWLSSLQGLMLNTLPADLPGIVVLAVKPQMMGDALPDVAASIGADTIVISIAAGTPITAFEAAFGEGARVVRAMPNTPAAIGRGITALVGNKAASTHDLDVAERLLQAVGDTVVLEREADIDAVTAVSGSGPAYVFHLIETMAAAGVAEGLSPDLAMQLARATVIGAGALAGSSSETAAQLRVNVTSPGGTTAAALGVLMDQDKGLPPLMKDAVAAAAARARELGQ